jgi:hypothetical protein
MDTVTILRDLWRFRLLVLGVWFLALLAGTAVLYKISWPLDLETRKYEVGVATTSILVDTPSSQVVEVAPKGSDSLGVRANLIASLMVDGTVKASIARNAGLKPEELVGISTTAGAPDQPVAPHARNAPVLTTRVVTDNDGSELPIIQIEAQARDAEAAARLASAAISGLRDYLDSKAAIQRIPNAQRLQVTGLGQSQARSATRGPKDFFAVAAVLFVFALGCAAVLALNALVRGWRDADAQERGDEPAAAEPDRTIHVVQPDEDEIEEALAAVGEPTWVTPPPVALVVSHGRSSGKSRSGASANGSARGGNSAEADGTPAKGSSRNGASATGKPANGANGTGSTGKAKRRVRSV